jgi:CDP-glucose 4,6-dehydratase
MNWKNKKVLITGHTGFKGGWLSLILAHKGAKVVGYALKPSTKPSFFHAVGLDKKITSVIGDINNLKEVKKVFKKYKPEIVFHLAAQPLVRKSYQSPVETYQTNVIGTANILESVKETGSVKVVVCITTDKCYENNEWVWGYREEDKLGGHDPYSSSKACAELVISSYRNSFFSSKDNKIMIASARAGNVIGGGDWSEDRLIPDVVKSIFENKNLEIRNPDSVRPWQHVLDPLYGYLKLAEKLYISGKEYAESFNFGPDNDEVIPVKKVLNHLSVALGKKVSLKKSKVSNPHEAGLLLLDSSKAKRKLNWQGKLKIAEAVKYTADWYSAFYLKKSSVLSKENMEKLTIAQIRKYEGN